MEATDISLVQAAVAAPAFVLSQAWEAVEVASEGRAAVEEVEVFGSIGR